MRRSVFKKMCVAAVALATAIASSVCEVSVMAADGVTVLFDEADTLASLNAGAVPNEGEWYKTAAAESNTITLSGEVTAAAIQEMPEVQSGKIWANPDNSKSGIQMYKQWGSGSNVIHFGQDGKYHLSWKQYMPDMESYNGAWGRGSYLAIVRGYGTKVLETVRIGFDDAYVPKDEEGKVVQVKDSEYYPAIYCYASNTATSSSVGDIEDIEKRTARAETPAVKGKFYVCDAYITTAKTGDDTIEFRCYPYGESEENAITVTNTFACGNTCPTLRFYNYSLRYQAGKQGIADLKIEKITDDAGTYDALRAEAAGFNPDFGAISSQEELDAAAEYALNDGAALTWSSNNEDIIAVENGKLTLQSGAFGKMCLTAKLEKGGVYVEKSFPAEVLKQQEPSKIIISEDLTGMEGKTLSEIAAEPSKGWESGYTENNGSLAASEVISTVHGNAIAVKASKPDENTNPIVDFTRKMTAGIDFDMDRTYYLTWNQMMDSYKGQYKSQRLQLLGETLEVDGARTEASGTPVAVSAMFNTMTVLTDDTETTKGTINNNKFDGDYYPARLFTKNGSGSMSTPVSSFVAQKGRMYTFVVRIDASETENDIISIKAYPAGTPAATDWQLVENRRKIAGFADTIGFFAQPSSEDAAILYSDLKIDSISNADIKEYEAAEALMKTGSKAEALSAVENLPVNGAWKAELLKEAETKNDFLVGAAAFLQDDVLYFDTDQTDEEGNTITTEKECNVMTTRLIKGKDIIAKISVKNNTDAQKDCVVVAAMFADDGTLIDVKISENIEAAAKASTDYSVTLQGDNNADVVKLFILDSMNGIKPLSSIISIDSYELMQ